MPAVAGGQLLLANKKKETFPTDWTADKDGRATDNPDKAFAGFLLPMAGHKCFGLTLVVDILCGVITGGAFRDKMKGMYRYPEDTSLTGHFMIAINPLSIMSREVYKERMVEFCQVVKSSPMWDSSKEMLIPGGGGISDVTRAAEKWDSHPYSNSLKDRSGIRSEKISSLAIFREHHTIRFSAIHL